MATEARDLGTDATSSLRVLTARSLAETNGSATRTGKQYVYTVHTVHPREIRSPDTAWELLPDAEDRASKISTDPEVLAAAVTRFTLNALGERHPIALYVGGMRQELPHVSDDRRVLANGLKQRW